MTALEGLTRSITHIGDEYGFHRHSYAIWRLGVTLPWGRVWEGQEFVGAVVVVLRRAWGDGELGRARSFA